jgi:outer membrane biosynthesis protein TonB
MSLEARKRFRLAPALTWLALAVPVAAGGYYVYQKYRALSDGGTRAAADTRPQAPERVWVVAGDEPHPLLRDPGRRQEGVGAVEIQPATPGADHSARKRVISLGPSPRPEPRAETQAAPPPPAPPTSSGPRFYEAAPASPVPTESRRRRGVIAESDPTQVSGSSLSAGPGQFTAGSNP